MANILSSLGRFNDGEFGMQAQEILEREEFLLYAFFLLVSKGSYKERLSETYMSENQRIMFMGLSFGDCVMRIARAVFEANPFENLEDAEIDSMVDRYLEKEFLLSEFVDDHKAGIVKRLLKEPLQDICLN